MVLRQRVGLGVLLGVLCIVAANAVASRIHIAAPLILTSLLGGVDQRTLPRLVARERIVEARPVGVR